MSEQRNYMAEVQALIDLKWKENPEEMKRVMADIKAKEKEKAKVKNQKRVSFDPQLTQELIEELNKDWDVVDMSKVQDLLDRGADVKAKDEWGQTPLHRASIENHIETAKLLIEAGADVKAKDKWGATPLHWASVKNSIELAVLLIEKGADVGAKDNDGWTPLYVAHSDGMKTLLKKYMK
jgi:ankyrin repeat protein